ncbi:MAG: secondary thiamine-phosphate synthase enzyme YjbQ [Candidatus Saccharimonadales bacterium]
MQEIVINTKSKRQVIDITDSISRLLDNEEGVAHIFVSHTTAALSSADLDPGTDLDLLECLNAIIPDLKWRHPHDPTHTPDHLISTIIGPSIAVPYSGQKLHLGVWQRVILIELDGPRQRKIILSQVHD